LENRDMDEAVRAVSACFRVQSSHAGSTGRPGISRLGTRTIGVVAIADNDRLRGVPNESTRSNEALLGRADGFVPAA
jgi:hypothetical protein